MSSVVQPEKLPRGPIMADVAAFSLTPAERQRLLHPAIGGVILFRRNYQSRAQLIQLVAEIKALRSPELIVAVDHEGGRVQRFISEFTPLPAMRKLGCCWDRHGAIVAEKWHKLLAGYLLLSCVPVALICRLHQYWIWIGENVQSLVIGVFMYSQL